MHPAKLTLALVFAVVAPPALGEQPGPSAPYPPDHGPDHVSAAARETGQVMRRGWRATKQAARETGEALEKGWRKIEGGIRWGWNHPETAPDQPRR